MFDNNEADEAVRTAIELIKNDEQLRQNEAEN